jgi:hypothetical protein
MADRQVARNKKTVKLATPIEWFGKRLAEIELREPTGSEYIRLGDPRVLVRSQTGSGYFVEQNEVIEKYLDACITIDGGASIMAQLNLQDAMTVKMEMLGFFLAAAATTAARNSTSSSSD